MDVLRIVKQHATVIDELTLDASWVDRCLPGLGTSRLVLLGEATHGTHDFYRMRAEITKRLITEKGFCAVAVEADWPDAYRVNQYVRGESEDPDAEKALEGFKRFPTWMWRNADVLDFVGWLREYNASLPPTRPKAGFYGMDLYSLFTSMKAVIEFLQAHDPQSAEQARQRYSCFDLYGENSQRYGYSVGLGLSKSCEQEVVATLQELHRLRSEPTEAWFSVKQNARVVQNAEAYYRTMVRGDISSWNLRDQHMMDTLDLLLEQLSLQVEEPKIVVWAHNSHLGDARYTEMGRQGEWNVGELAKTRHGANVYSVGFTTYCGTVTAASGWDAPAERKNVRPALPQSYESLFHQSGIPEFVLDFRDQDFLQHALARPRLERAIGVIYRPETERASHYFSAALSRQFDAVFHLDRTRAVEPLEPTAQWQEGEAPETYPSAL